MTQDSGPQDPGPSSPHDSGPSFSSIAVTLLILLAAAATIALFAIPLQNPWFWPTAAVLAASIGLGLLIPLKAKAK